MKKKFLMALILMLAMTISLPGCSDSTPPSQPKAGGTAVSTEAEARKLLQSWLDSHTFSAPVNINDAMTSEDDGGLMFVLFRHDEEFATIRVAKATGRLLQRKPGSNNYISIDDWYAGLKDTPSVEPPTPGPAGSDHPGELLYRGIPVAWFSEASIGDMIDAFNFSAPVDYGSSKYNGDDMDVYYDPESGAMFLLESMNLEKFEMDGVSLDKNRAGLMDILGTPTDDYESGSGYALSFHLADCYVYFDLGDPNEPAWRIYVYPGGGHGDDYEGEGYEDGISDWEYEAALNYIDGNFEWVEQPTRSRANQFGGGWDWDLGIYIDPITIGQLIEGTVRNISGKSYSYVQITYTLFDSKGNQVGTALDTIANLGAGNTWRFSAAYYESNVTRFEFFGITAF